MQFNAGLVANDSDASLCHLTKVHIKHSAVDGPSSTQTHLPSVRERIASIACKIGFKAHSASNATYSEVTADRAVFEPSPTNFLVVWYRDEEFHTLH